VATGRQAVCCWFHIRMQVEIGFQGWPIAVQGDALLCLLSSVPERGLDLSLRLFVVPLRSQAAHKLITSVRIQRTELFDLFICLLFKV
jgi:hypothetical protein